MKRQWGLIFSLIFALIIALFSVINVNTVKVNYLFGTAQWPLILVILTSVLMGALLVGSFGIVRMYRLQRHISRLNRQISKMTSEHEQLESDFEKSKEALNTVTEEGEEQADTSSEIKSDDVSIEEKKNN